MGKVFGEFIVFVIRSGFGTRGLPLRGVRPSRTICSTARTDSPSFSIFFVEAELVLGIFQTEDGARMPCACRCSCRADRAGFQPEDAEGADGWR